MLVRVAAASTILVLTVVQCMTPEQMLSAPRYSSAVANAAGEWALYSSQAYSFDDGTETVKWWLMNIKTRQISKASLEDDASEAVWVGDTDTSILYVSSKNDTPGGVTLWSLDLADSSAKAKKVASLPAPYSGLKAARTPAGDINFLLNCLAYKGNGSAYNADVAPVSPSTGRLYDSIYVRHWDQYVTQERYAVFAGTLSSSGSSYEFDDDMTNLLFGLDYNVTRPECPVQPYGGSGDYDISPDGSTVVFLTKAPQLPKANYTASYLYLVPHDGSSGPMQLNGPGSSAPVDAQGASGAPVWSPDGKSIAYFQQNGVSYESDRSKLYVANVGTYHIKPVAENWDLSAAVIKWSNNCDDLYVASDYLASTRLFIIPADAGVDFEPANITDITSVSDYYVLPAGDVLVTANAVWSNFNVYIASRDGDANYLFKSNEQNEEMAGLGPSDVDYVWYEGTLGDQQQAIVVYPENFEPSKIYPLIFYVHGGPQGYTGNVWSTRWNLKTWADQGYVLFGPNPTGSTSYGQNLTDRIQGRWGSWPYDDLVNAHTWACENLAFVNCSNAIAAGASYGAYMMNWIQGHPLGREFKALVSHDGVTTTFADYASEELWFIQHDMNGTIWDNRATYRAWDPLRHAKNFATPQFVVHNELDYRLPVSEGIMMFNVLQEMGVPSRFLNFPDEGHWVLNPENSLFWHTEIYNWINYWSGKVAALDDNAITE